MALQTFMLYMLHRRQCIDIQMIDFVAQQGQRAVIFATRRVGHALSRSRKAHTDHDDGQAPTTHYEHQARTKIDLDGGNNANCVLSVLCAMHT